MNNQATVEVLLATYNGDRFLREQVDSIVTQDYKSLHVLARDDGSSDETATILNEYAGRYPARFRVMPVSPGTGSAKDNFLLLMKASSANYVCFSDQDDVWLHDKVSKTKEAMDRLESKWGAHVPLLVFTDLRVVDDQLKLLYDSFWALENINPEHINRFAALLGQNVVTGSTAMVNRPLVELCLKMPPEAFMHDRWIALLAATMGKAQALHFPTVLYRQHNRNVLGAGKQRSAFEMIRRLRNRRERRTQWQINQSQAQALLRLHSSQFSAQHRELLRAYLRCGATKSRLVRITTFLRYGFYRLGSSVNLATMLDI